MICTGVRVSYEYIRIGENCYILTVDKLSNQDNLERWKHCLKEVRPGEKNVKNVDKTRFL